jgi:hypothetical protein
LSQNLHTTCPLLFACTTEVNREELREESGTSQERCKSPHPQERDLKQVYFCNFFISHLEASLAQPELHVLFQGAFGPENLIGMPKQVEKDRDDERLQLCFDMRGV